MTRSVLLILFAVLVVPIVGMAEAELIERGQYHDLHLNKVLNKTHSEYITTLQYVPRVHDGTNWVNFIITENDSSIIYQHGSYRYVQFKNDLSFTVSEGTNNHVWRHEPIYKFNDDWVEANAHNSKGTATHTSNSTHATITSEKEYDALTLKLTTYLVGHEVKWTYEIKSKRTDSTVFGMNMHCLNCGELKIDDEVKNEDEKFELKDLYKQDLDAFKDEEDKIYHDIFLGDIKFDHQNDIHDLLGGIDKTGGNVLVRYDENDTAIKEGDVLEIDPVVNLYVSNYAQSLYSTIDATNQDCYATYDSLFRSTEAELYGQVRRSTTGSASYCTMTATQYNITSIPDTATINDLDLVGNYERKSSNTMALSVTRWDSNSSPATVSNNDFFNQLKDGAYTIIGTAGYGGGYRNIDLSNDAISDFNDHLSNGIDWWGVGARLSHAWAGHSYSYYGFGEGTYPTDRGPPYLQVYFTSATLPGPVTTLGSRDTDKTSTELFWTAPVAGSNPITGYQVNYTLGYSTNPTTVLVNDTSTTLTTLRVTDLALDTIYSFRVGAWTAVGNGGGTAHNIQTLPGDPPGPVDTLQGSATGPTEAQIRWQRPANVGDGTITGYQINRTSPHGIPNTVLVADTGTTTTSYTDTGLTAEVGYSYRVSAITEWGKNAEGNILNVTTHITPTVPDAVTSLSARMVNYDTALLRWTQPYSFSPITGYQVNYTTPLGNPLTIYVNNTQKGEYDPEYDFNISESHNYFTFTHLNDLFYMVDDTNDYLRTYFTNGTRYSTGDIDLSDWFVSMRGVTVYNNNLWVVGVNNDGLGWNARGFFTNGTYIPDTRFGLSGLNTNPYDMTYINDRFYVADGIDNKAYAYSTSGGRAIPDDVSFDSDSASVLGMVGAKNLLWTVDSDSDSIKAYSLNGTNLPQFTFSLTALNNVPKGLTFFNDHLWVTQTTGQNKVFSYRAPDTETQIEIYDLNHNSNYSFRVGAWSAIGFNATGNIANVTTRAPTPPGPVNTLTADSIGLHHIGLDWDTPTSGEGTITGYQINFTTPHGDPLGVMVNDTGSLLTQANITGLSVATQYSFRVSAWSEFGNNASGNRVDTATLTPGLAGNVNTLQATATGNTTADLRWSTPSSGDGTITGYQINLSLGTATPDTVLINNTQSTTTEATVTDLLPQTQYSFRVGTWTDYGISAGGNIQTITTWDVPDRVTTLQANAIDAFSGNLTWTAPATHGIPITGYQILYNEGSSTPTTVLVNDTGTTTTSYDLDDLTSSTTYSYTVAPWSALGKAPTSNIASLTTPAVQLPTAPINLQTTSSTLTSINIAWFPPSSSGDGTIIGYQINRTSPHGDPTTVYINNTRNTSTLNSIQNLDPDTQYSFTVAAWSQYGLGAVSDRLDTATNTPGLPSAVSTLTATVTGGETVDLRWFTPNSGDGTISGYQVNYTQGTGTPNQVLVNDTSSLATDLEVTDLDLGTTYSFRVGAWTEYGTNANGNIRTVTTWNVPDRIADLTARANGPFQTILNWSVPTSDATVTGYQILYTVGSGTPNTILINNTSSNSYVHSDLTSNTQYRYTVSAWSSVGQSQQSNIASATTPQIRLPSAPNSLTSPTQTHEIIGLNWTTPNPGDGTIFGYQINVTTPHGTPTTVLVNNTGNTDTDATVTNLAPATQYSFRVAAWSQYGLGTVGNTLNTATVAANLPNPVTTLSATTINTFAIQLLWNAPNPGDGTITGYRIFYTEGAGEPNQVLVNDTGNTNTSYAVGSLDAGTQYGFRVAAITEFGTNPSGNVARTTTYDRPDPINTLTATATSHTVGQLSWQRPNANGSTISGYQVNYTIGIGTPTTILVNHTGTAEPGLQVTGLDPDTTYTYAVASWSNFGKSLVSNNASLTTPIIELPGPVNTLRLLSTTHDTISVGWNIPTAGDGTISGYQINYTTPFGTNPQTIYVNDTDSTATSFTLTGLQPNTGYSIRVGAWTEHGTNANGNVVGGTTSIASGPNPVTTLEAIPYSPTTGQLDWDAPTPGDGIIRGYRINFTVGTGTPNTILINDTRSTQTSFNLSNLVAATTYSFRVAAWTEYGTNPNGNIATLTTFTVPDAVDDLRASPITNSTGILRWTAPEDHGSTITGYQINYSGVPGIPNTVLVNDTGSTTTTYNLADLLPRTSYAYRVLAWSNYGPSPVSNLAVMTTPGDDLPNSINTLTAVATAYNAITLTWSTPDLKEYDLEGYQINYSIGASNNPNTVLINNTNSPAISQRITGLDVATQYSFRVGAWAAPTINVTGANVVNITTLGAAFGNVTTDGGNIDQLSIRYNQEVLNATATRVLVDFPESVRLNCDVETKFARTTTHFTNLPTQSSVGDRDTASILIRNPSDDIVTVYCYDALTGQNAGTYVLSPVNTDVPFLQQITAFSDGEFGTGGQIGTLDMVLLAVIIISMIGFNRSNEAVGTIFASSLLLAADWFDIVQTPTVFFGAMALLVMLAITGTRKQ